MTPSAEETCTILAAKLQKREPFIFTKFGDGDVQFMYNLRDGRTADGEVNCPALSAGLWLAWMTLASQPTSYVADFKTYSDFGPRDEQKHFAEWEEMVALAGVNPWPGPLPTLVHMEALLSNRLSPELRHFYEVLRSDPIEKVLVAPARLSGACRMLRCSLYEIPLATAWEVAEEAVERLDRSTAEVLIFCAGRASKLIMAGLMKRKPGRTMIDLGSGLDPLFCGQTRGVQVDQAAALKYFSALLQK